MTATSIEIPDIGDAKDVEVIEICVGVGDDVAKDDALIVIESEKASMEVPSTVNGKVSEILLALGDIVNTGDKIAVVDASDSAQEPVSVVEEEGAQADLEDASSEQEVERDSTPATVQAPVETETTPTDAGSSVYAGPSVRKLARELGVDLTRVNGSGAKGRIVKDDVKAFVKTTLTSQSAMAAGTGIPSIELPDFSAFGPVEEVPLTRIRARGAQNLVRSWLNVVHVTQHDEADVTELEQFRSELNSDLADRSQRLTPLPFILKACACSLLEHPFLNSSLNTDLKSLICKKYVHLGMAVDTDEGLVVPVIRDVDKKGVQEISMESNVLASAAQDKKLKPGDIQGASFTVSSLGNIGGTGFTPIVNAPEVAILGVGRMSVKPVWMNGEFVPRRMLPLSLSYDHRAVNGADAGRFMTTLVSKLADIRKLVL